MTPIRCLINSVSTELCHLVLTEALDASIRYYCWVRTDVLEISDSTCLNLPRVICGYVVTVYFRVLVVEFQKDSTQVKYQVEDTYCGDRHDWETDNLSEAN